MQWALSDLEGDRSPEKPHLDIENCNALITVQDMVTLHRIDNCARHGNTASHDPYNKSLRCTCGYHDTPAQPSQVMHILSHVLDPPFFYLGYLLYVLILVDFVV